MRRSLSLFALLLAGVCAGRLHAAPWARTTAAAPPWAAEPLSLGRCVELALADVPSEQARQARLAAAKALLVQAKTIPNPLFSYTAQDIGLAGASGPALLHQQALSFAPLYGYRASQEAKLAAAQVAQVAADIEEDRRLLRLAVGRAYYEARLAMQLAAIETQAVEGGRELVAKTARRVQHGDAGQLEVVRAQAEELEAQSGLELAVRRRDLSLLALSVLLGAEQPLPVTLSASASAELLPQALRLAAEAPATGAVHERLLALARAARPDLRAAQAQLRRATEQQRLEVRRAVPLADLQLVVGARESAAGVGGLVAFSLPLPLFDHNAGPRASAAAQAESARAALAATERQIALEIATALREWQGAGSALLQIARPLVQLREQALVAANRQFAEGIVGLLEVVTAQRDLLASRRALARVEQEVSQAGWRLRLAVLSQ